MELRREVAALRREMAVLSAQVAALPQPERPDWQRSSAPDLVAFPRLDIAPSPLLQLLFSSSQRS